MGEGDAAWNTLERVSYVWLKDRWVAYPFQVGAGACLGFDALLPSRQLRGPTCFLAHSCVPLSVVV